MAAQSQATSRNADSRARLIDVGVQAFSESGFGEVSIVDVAKRAGVATGLLYYYFPSKRHFFRAVVRRISDEMERATDADSSLPPPEQLRSGLEANVRYAREHAAAFRTILRGGGSGDPAVQRIVEGRRRRGVERVVAGLSIGEPSPALLIAIRGWIGYFEEATLAWLDETEVSEGEFIDLLVATLASALREAGARSSHSAALHSP